MNSTKLIAVCIVLALIGGPTVSFAKARGGGGGYGSGSRSSGGIGSMGSRGSRTHDPNGGKPMDQSITPKPSATGPQAAASPAPTTLQRHPWLTGLAAGLAGSWISHWLFGATESSAKTNEDGEPVDGADQTSGGFPFNGILLFMLMGGGLLYYMLKGRAAPASVLSGVRQPNTATGSLMPEAAPVILQTAAVDTEVTLADKAAFQHLLVEIQTAWGRQDLSAMRRLVTPEMLAYFSTALAAQTSQQLENRVEDVVPVRAEVEEAWREGTAQYATAQLCWTARDYTVSLTKQPGEPGYLVGGSDETPSETSELWTFMRYRQGNWLLCAIQQVA